MIYFNLTNSKLLKILLFLRKSTRTMKRILTVFLFLISIHISSQEVIAVQGRSYTNTLSSIDFTIGEPVISTFSIPSTNLTQGLHQTNLTVLGLDDFNTEYAIKVFPNPTNDIIKLDLIDYQNLKFGLYDILGREIKKNSITDRLTQINMEHLNQGIYILTILSENNEKLKTYKIIKN